MRDFKHRRGGKEQQHATKDVRELKPVVGRVGDEHFPNPFAARHPQQVDRQVRVREGELAEVEHRADAVAGIGGDGDAGDGIDGLARDERMAQAELQAFTYWLSKYRVRTGEPARVASDTKKAMAMMSRLEAGRARAHGREFRSPMPTERAPASRASSSSGTPSPMVPVPSST